MKEGKGKSESNNDQRYIQANKNPATMGNLVHENFIIGSLFDFRRVMHILWLAWGEAWYVNSLGSGI